MKKRLWILPVMIGLLFVISSLLLAKGASYTFRIKNLKGNAEVIRNLEYDIKISDKHMQWNLQGKGTNLTYETTYTPDRFIPTKKGTGFYLYIPYLLDGKRIEDYPPSRTSYVVNEKESEGSTYDVDSVGVQLMVKTKDGYACFDTGMIKEFASIENSIFHNEKEDQLYFQSNDKQKGTYNASFIRHAIVNLDGKQYVALFQTDGFSGGENAIYRIDQSYETKEEEVPSVQEALKKTKVTKLTDLPGEASDLQELIVYQGYFYAAIFDGQNIGIYQYDKQGNLLQKMENNQMKYFDSMHVQDDCLYFVTHSEKQYQVQIFDQDNKEIYALITSENIRNAKLSYQNGILYGMNIRRNSAQVIEEQQYIFAFDEKELLYEGVLTGDFSDDRKIFGSEEIANIDIESLYFREVVSFRIR